MSNHKHSAAKIKRKDGETQNGAWAPVSLFWGFLLSSFKILNLDVSKKFQKIRRRSKCCTPSLCKFLP
jgi:hypothetical protein